MRPLLLPLVVLSLSVACARHAASPDVSLLEDMAGVTLTAAPPETLTPPCPDGGVCPEEAEDESEDDQEGETAEPVQEEAEAREPSNAPEGIRYTMDFSDEVLLERWKTEPESLGSISIGFADEGRLVNARAFPEGVGWSVVSPEKTWGTSETIDFMLAAIAEVQKHHPQAPPLRVNRISAPEGGYLPPHKSHQNGRDVDLGFYYRASPPRRTRDRYRFIDPRLNWALVKALVTQADVQLILVDRKVQKVLYDWALEAGEDKTWLDALFHSGRRGLIQHARRHRDHFHVRFYNARAQELGRRVAPLLALRPEQNVVLHHVRPRQNLGLIARKYGTTVTRLKKTNRLPGSFLRVGQILRVALRGPCTRCPVPPPVVVPTRVLPPGLAPAVAPSPSPPAPVPVSVSATAASVPPSTLEPAPAVPPPAAPSPSPPPPKLLVVPDPPALPPDPKPGS